MTTNTVTTIWKGNNDFETNNPSEHKLIMFNNSDDNGTKVGFAPKALMLSSLAGCSGLDVVSLLKKMRAEVTDFKIEVTGELTEEHPKFYYKVKVDYHFSGNDLKEDKIKKAVDLSVEKYCGVMEMFRQFAEVKTEIFLHKK
ncbi:OsmC family protein [Polaribacter sp. MSW13]|uniref:OsmC family protein n=1 Tax=Polaribacter marinus TaxID=2916838 RepID=A0A9X1VR58_9FLAO|nr:OsmC family protein [Polaribacter marinus]MCI2229240.1 OsmC family protein [Polaribacter marinus]